MRAAVALLVVSALCLGCGARKGPEAGSTYFWKVLTSNLAWGACSDEPGFRASVKVLPVSDNTYITYRVEKDGAHATALSCARLDERSCTPSADGVVFDIAGAELTWSHQQRAPVGSSSCNLVQAESWTFQDKISTFALDISTALSLDGDKATCDRVEANQKAGSPNGLGVQACVITFTLTGELR